MSMQACLRGAQRAGGLAKMLNEIESHKSNVSTATKTIQQRVGGQAGLYILAGECLCDDDQVIWKR